MGKNGAAMRAEKAQKTIYTFTREQLAEHDRQVVKSQEAYLQKRLEEMKQEKNRELDEYLQEEWKKREELYKLDKGGFMDLLSLMLCVPARVLIEKFGWQPIPKDGVIDSELDLVRFTECVVEEMNRINEDELKDLRKYSEETYALYGVKYASQDAKGE